MFWGDDPEGQVLSTRASKWVALFQSAKPVYSRFAPVGCALYCRVSVSILGSPLAGCLDSVVTGAVVFMNFPPNLFRIWSPLCCWCVCVAPARARDFHRRLVCWWKGANRQRCVASLCVDGGVSGGKTCMIIFVFGLLFGAPLVAFGSLLCLGRRFRGKLFSPPCIVDRHLANLTYSVNKKLEGEAHRKKRSARLTWPSLGEELSSADTRPLCWRMPKALFS